MPEAPEDPVAAPAEGPEFDPPPGDVEEQDEADEDGATPEDAAFPEPDPEDPGETVDGDQPEATP